MLEGKSCVKAAYNINNAETKNVGTAAWWARTKQKLPLVGSF